MESLPASLAERLRELTYNERSVAYLQVDAALLLIGAGGHLENYGLAAIRLGEPAAEQVFFLEGLLPLEETPFFVPSVELDCGRAADLHLYLDAGTVWVVLLDVTAYRDATRRLQQKAYEMTLLQEKEAQLNRRLEETNRGAEAANDFFVRISTRSRTTSPANLQKHLQWSEGRHYSHRTQGAHYLLLRYHGFHRHHRAPAARGDHPPPQ